MNKLAQYLQKYIAGEIQANQKALKYFSTDGSVFSVMPKIIAYPRNALDIAKLVSFSWQLAQRGKILPITARGKGTDQGGGSLGTGLIVVFPAYMHKLLGFDKKQSVTIQPGMLYGDLERTLISHGRWLPPYPSSVEFSTLGGAIANNACGEKTLKYGCMGDYVQSLQVVLANGQEITAKRLSKKELNRKKGQTDFEGDIYRQLDGLLLDNEELIANAAPKVTKNAAGYNLWKIKGRDGSFDLTRLLVGSQGTLGIVAEATLRTEPHNPHSHLMALYFDKLKNVDEAILQLYSLAPSAMEVVDYHLLNFLAQNQPQRLAGIIEGELPKVMLLVEFDDVKARLRNRKVKQARKLLHELVSRIDVVTDPSEQEALWQIRRSAGAGMWKAEGNKQAVPLIEDGVVPVHQFSKFLDKLYKLFEKHHLDIEVSGHGGDANLHIKPLLDLGATADRQMVFKLMDDFYKMVIKMGGSTTGEHNDGRLRAPYLKDLYGEKMYELFEQVKQIFDPYNILNPGVKLGVSKEDLKPLLRREYSLKHLYDHMPHRL